MRVAKRSALLYTFILPAMLFFAIFTFYPLMKGIYISFQEYGLLGARGFAGFSNYIEVLKDIDFRDAVINTLVISFGILIIGFTFPIFIAISLNELTSKGFKKFSQTIIYVPFLFSWVVIIGIWNNILSPTGLVNQFLMNIRMIDNPIGFFGEAKFARELVVLMTIWKDMGYSSIIYLAAMSAIDPHLYEAADIDGAKLTHKIRYITFPLLIPTMKIIFLITLMGVLRTFDSVYIMSNGAIAHKIRTVVVFTYEKGLLRFDLGIATAAAILLFLITMVFTTVLKKVIRY